MEVITYLLISIGLILLTIAIYDVFQKKNTITRNFPLLGRLRNVFILLGPPIRQYFIASNRDELPFNRSQRNWIDSSSKKENNYEGFGTDKDLYKPGHIFVNPKMFPFKVDHDHINYEKNDPYFIPCAKGKLVV